jgi:hypothetical protein
LAQTVAEREADRWFRPPILMQVEHASRVATNLNWISESGDYCNVHAGIVPVFPPITREWLVDVLTHDSGVPGTLTWCGEDATRALIRLRPKGLASVVEDLISVELTYLIKTGQREAYFAKLVDLVVGLDLRDVAQRWVKLVTNADKTVDFYTYPAEVKRAILTALLDMKCGVHTIPWRKLANDPDCLLSAFVALSKLDRDDALALCTLMPDDPQVAEVVSVVYNTTWRCVSERWRYEVDIVRMRCAPLIREALYWEEV